VALDNCTAGMGNCMEITVVRGNYLLLLGGNGDILRGDTAGMGTKFTVIPCERATGTRVAVVPRYIDFIFYNFQGIQARTGV